MITCQGTTQTEKSNEHVSISAFGTSPYVPVHARRAKRAIAAV